MNKKDNKTINKNEQALYFKSHEKEVLSLSKMSYRNALFSIFRIISKFNLYHAISLLKGERKFIINNNNESYKRSRILNSKEDYIKHKKIEAFFKIKNKTETSIKKEKPIKKKLKVQNNDIKIQGEHTYNYDKNEKSLKCPIVNNIKNKTIFSNNLLMKKKILFKHIIKSIILNKLFVLKKIIKKWIPNFLIRNKIYEKNLERNSIYQNKKRTKDIFSLIKISDFRIYNIQENIFDKKILRSGSIYPKSREVEKTKVSLSLNKFNDNWRVVHKSIQEKILQDNLYLCDCNCKLKNEFLNRQISNKNKINKDSLILYFGKWKEKKNNINSNELNKLKDIFHNYYLYNKGKLMRTHNDISKMINQKNEDNNETKDINGVLKGLKDLSNKLKSLKRKNLLLSIFEKKNSKFKDKFKKIFVEWKWTAKYIKQKEFLEKRKNFIIKRLKKKKIFKERLIKAIQHIQLYLYEQIFKRIEDYVNKNEQNKILIKYIKNKDINNKTILKVAFNKWVQLLSKIKSKNYIIKDKYNKSKNGAFLKLKEKVTLKSKSSDKTKKEDYLNLKKYKYKKIETIRTFRKFNYYNYNELEQIIYEKSKNGLGRLDILKIKNRQFLEKIYIKGNFIFFSFNEGNWKKHIIKNTLIRKIINIFLNIDITNKRGDFLFLESKRYINKFKYSFFFRYISNIIKYKLKYDYKTKVFIKKKIGNWFNETNKLKDNENNIIINNNIKWIKFPKYKRRVGQNRISGDRIQTMDEEDKNLMRSNGNSPIPTLINKNIIRLYENSIIIQDYFNYMRKIYKNILLNKSIINRIKGCNNFEILFFGFFELKENKVLSDSFQFLKYKINNRKRKIIEKKKNMINKYLLKKLIILKKYFIGNILKAKILQCEIEEDSILAFIIQFPYRINSPLLIKIINWLYYI